MADGRQQCRAKKPRQHGHFSSCCTDRVCTTLLHVRGFTVMQASNSYRGFESSSGRQRGARTILRGVWHLGKSRFVGVFRPRTDPNRPEFRASFRPLRAFWRPFLRALMVKCRFVNHHGSSNQIFSANKARADRHTVGMFSSSTRRIMVRTYQSARH